MTEEDRARNLRRVLSKRWPDTPEQRARDLAWYRFWTGYRYEPGKRDPSFPHPAHVSIHVGS